MPRLPFPRRPFLPGRAFAAALLSSALLAACGGDSSTTPDPAPPALDIPFSATDLEEGSGAEASDGDLVAGAYQGWIYDETADDNRGREFAVATAEDPIVFRLGAGQAIAGVDAGVVGMRVGGRRRIVIPPDQGWGAGGTASVPANAHLLVEFELLFADPVPYQQTDLEEGTGDEAAEGDSLSVTYTGWLYDPFADDHRGEQFDSAGADEPFTFTLGSTGTGGVIAGWNRGVAGMRVGGRRRLVVPHDQAYGEAGRSGSIPGYATLLFEIELLSVN